MSNTFYGELYFTGPCNFACFYCIGREVHADEKVNNAMRQHFSQWPGYHEWKADLHAAGITTVFLSSTVTEPLIYRDLDELVDDLITDGFDVGLRSNASMLTLDTIPTLRKMRAEISLSLQALDDETHQLITGRPVTVDLHTVLNMLHEAHIRYRVTVVVNTFNEHQIGGMLNALQPYADDITYVQLRRYYSVNHDQQWQTQGEAFKRVKDALVSNNPIHHWFFESPVYTVGDLQVSLWETVFTETSVRSLNYWTNGVRTNRNLLVPSYRREMRK